MATMVGVTDQERSWFTQAQKDHDAAINGQEKKEGNTEAHAQVATVVVSTEVSKENKEAPLADEPGKPGTPTSTLATAPDNVPAKMVPEKQVASLGAAVEAETPSVASG